MTILLNVLLGIWLLVALIAMFSLRNKMQEFFVGAFIFFYPLAYYVLMTR